MFNSCFTLRSHPFFTSFVPTMWHEDRLLLAGTILRLRTHVTLGILHPLLALTLFFFLALSYSFFFILRMMERMKDERSKLKIPQ